MISTHSFFFIKYIQNFDSMTRDVIVPPLFSENAIFTESNQPRIYLLNNSS